MVSRITTSRQTIAASQRTSNYKVSPAIVSGRKCLVVRLDWTNAPVVRTTIRRDFRLFVTAMDTRSWTIVGRGPMNLKAGQVVHFVQSDDHPGYYYVIIVGESCTCTAGLFKQDCHHQTDAASFEARRAMAIRSAQVMAEVKAAREAMTPEEKSAKLRDSLAYDFGGDACMVAAYMPEVA